jgi:hypothetical protein
MTSSIFTPLSAAPVVDAERDDFLKKCMEETFLSAGKLDKKRVLKAAGKVGLQPPTGCGPRARCSATQLAAFAENVAYEIFDQAKFAASTPGGGSACPLPPPLPTILNGRLATPVAVARRNVQTPIRVARLARMLVLLCL